MNRLLQDWVSEQAEKRPDSIAIVLRDQRVSYGELERLSNQLARALRMVGCRKGDRVAFAIPKSPAAVIAMIGILKGDCVHVPIDTANPPARVAKILESSDPRCVLVTESTAKLLQESLARPQTKDLAIALADDSRMELDRVAPHFRWSDLRNLSPEPLDCASKPEDPAHILYTSGSTGDPKGVVITHANVIHFLEWAIRYFGIDSTDRLSCHPPLHFDLAGFDIFGAFGTGAELHLVPPDLAPLPNKIADFIRDSALTQWFSVPSVLQYMAKFDVVRFNDFPSLKRLLWCGEVLPTSALIYWMKRLPGVSFTNLYGPTETTIASSYYTVPSCPASDTLSIPIGAACQGEELLVLDEELRPLTPGTVGDLYIRGVGVSQGYWRDPGRTAMAFFPYGRDHQDRIYKTGDLAWVGEDGLAYFSGRSDSQIKSRGYRIELGEIEAAMNTLDQLNESVLVAIPTQAFEGNLICAAYVPRDKRLMPSAIRSKLSDLLPAYMFPTRWLALDQLPKNANGKIDRPKVRDMFVAQIASEQGSTNCASLSPCSSHTETVVNDDTSDNSIQPKRESVGSFPSL